MLYIQTTDIELFLYCIYKRDVGAVDFQHRATDLDRTESNGQNMNQHGLPFLIKSRDQVFNMRN